MNAVDDAIEKITTACLYEGYLLWPYRRSALKNTKRWIFGGVFPRDHAEALGERGLARTEVLVDAPDGATISARVRFLHVVDRTVMRDGPDGPEPVDELTVAGERHVSWQEATEREVVVSARLAGPPVVAAIDVPEGRDTEPLPGGAVVRTWRRLAGLVEVSTEPVAEGSHRLTVRIENHTPCPAPDPADRAARDKAAAYAFVSTHTVLHGDTALFRSLADPPDRLRAAAASCENLGGWPVLVGPDRAGGASAGEAADGAPAAHTVLASPVTLCDFPAVAPESPGDLFDGGEIDQLLILNVLSLTEEEQEEARACDPRAREILDRCARLSPEELGALHGTIREFRTLEDA
ncbi:hypothetical protein [Streptomyces sp. SAJ15]|uniref:hypothetical protein n=1 Tax=Streptomyces sp. SAJ15 TaxID=2011095 RepID=UPI00118557DC|nr:hypothetical protein [Streptomyces sp. SAJ15]TVL93363.1 hypothetical protein CD790_09735 [Streptomyces sp. SAJ15]